MSLVDHFRPENHYFSVNDMSITYKKVKLYIIRFYVK